MGDSHSQAQEFCEENDCNWVKVHNVAPGVTESNGEITDWYTEHESSTPLFKFNVSATEAFAQSETDTIELSGAVKRENVVVVTTIGDTVDDTPDATAADGPKTYQMESGGECFKYYTGKGGGASNNFWPNLSSHYFGDSTNYGDFSSSVTRTTLSSGIDDAAKQRQCAALCNRDDGCAGYYVYKSRSSFFGSYSYYCSQAANRRG